MRRDLSGLRASVWAPISFLLGTGAVTWAVSWGISGPEPVYQPCPHPPVCMTAGSHSTLPSPLCTAPVAQC